MNEQILEIKSWLKPILKSENVVDFSVTHVGNIDKGAGYLSDIVFVRVDATLDSNLNKSYHLALKSSKKDEVLREKSLMKEAFSSEIFLYDRVLPTYKKFVLEKNFEESVVRVPKFYGKITNANLEVLALENLRENGYKMNDKRKPMTRTHIDLVVSEYAKFHAISAAFSDQNSRCYKEFVSHIKPAFKKMVDTSDVDFMFGSKIDKACELLKQEIDEDVLIKWKNLRQQIGIIFDKMYNNETGLKVLVHGDCWNNNFMFKYKENNQDLPIEAVLLDLQLTSNSSPILDLSYFLFATISETDIKNLNNILDAYYSTFSRYLEKLGSKGDVIYPYEQFLNDWKVHCKYGLIIVPTVFYMCSTDEDEVIDSPNGDFTDTFTYDIKNPTIFLYRMKYVMEYATKHNLI